MHKQTMAKKLTISPEHDVNFKKVINEAEHRPMQIIVYVGLNIKNPEKKKIVVTIVKCLTIPVLYSSCILNKRCQQRNIPALTT